MVYPEIVSVLFANAADRRAAERAAAPDFFGDLNLDRIVDAVTADWETYDLIPYYRFALTDADAIAYRHEVFRDLENASLSGTVRAFAERMRHVRTCLAQAEKLHYALQKDTFFLDAVEAYGDAIRLLASELAHARMSSRGLVSLRDYLLDYAEGASFTALMDETSALKHDLSAVRYAILLKGDSFTVRPYDAETDYSAEIFKTFDKFKQGAVKDYEVRFRYRVEMNHIEARIAAFVAKLYPDLFVRLRSYCARHKDFIDGVIGAFDREIHFYFAYSGHLAKFSGRGLRFCYPHISADMKVVHARDAFDLALAQKLAAKDAPLVCNDFDLTGCERIIVVSGPNQGGKTTFARMFGQLHFLAALGCPVPGAEARLFLFDHLFAHFEREERAENLRGKLEDDLRRIYAILDRATPRSVIVLNEVFTSTTLQDEVFLSRKVMERLAARDLIGVWVTFVDELASFDERAVSMVSTIAPDNPALRTFKVIRQDADGLAFAMAIAEKYRLTYPQVKERIAT